MLSYMLLAVEYIGNVCGGGGVGGGSGCAGGGGGGAGGGGSVGWEVG